MKTIISYHEDDGPVYFTDEMRAERGLSAEHVERSDELRDKFNRLVDEAKVKGYVGTRYKLSNHGIASLDRADCLNSFLTCVDVYADFEHGHAIVLRHGAAFETALWLVHPGIPITTGYLPGYPDVNVGQFLNPPPPKPVKSRTPRRTKPKA